MEPLMVLVGFLGAGKTTLLKSLIKSYVQGDWQPTIILNDYENATLDSQQFLSFLPGEQVKALSGSCICCSGVNELRQQVNAIPPRDKGITLIEANGTTDAVTLMEFLGVGIKQGFHPPVQISVVDCRYWQKRGFHNELEANQIQVSSLIYLNHSEAVDAQRLSAVIADIQALNPFASCKTSAQFDPFSLVQLQGSANQAEKGDHQHSHWSSASVPLPGRLPSLSLQRILQSLPTSILRVKGCTKLDADEHYSYFEKIPTDEEAMVRPYGGTLVSGPTLLTVGPGSDPHLLRELVQRET